MVWTTHFHGAFQGQYNNRTNGARDFWIVSAFYLIFRICVLRNPVKVANYFSDAERQKNSIHWKIGQAGKLLRLSHWVQDRGAACKLPYVNASSRNGTLGTHPSLHLPKWESLKNVFRKVLSITFFMQFGQFPTFDVQKVPLLLDAFTYSSAVRRP